MSFTCPRCDTTSHNPNDEREGYCGACHDWTGPEAQAPTVESARCGLCQHEMALGECGWGTADGVPLCHAADHDCYHLWTVYGRRPAGGS